MIKRSAPLVALATALVIFGWLFLRPSSTPAPVEVSSPKAASHTVVPASAPATSSPQTASSASAPERSAPLPAPAPSGDFARLSADEVTPVVLAAAAQRRDAMLELMREEPARALAHSISWSEHAALPEVLLPYFEKPFNTLANLEILPVCEAPGREPVRQLLLDGRVYEANIYGIRLAQSSKSASPLSGITLDDRAVVAEEVLRVLSAEDARTLAALPIANSDPTRSFASGRPLGSAPVVAIAGGQRFFFRSSAEVVEFNTRLSSLDSRPGPHGGARVLFELPYPADATTGFDWPAAEAWSIELASAWTETPKNVFFIRVDFSDVPGESVSQAALANVLNTSVTESVAAMSYGKTSINAGVSSMVVRLPHPTTTYVPTNSNSLYNDALAAYLALAGANALNGYDIVGVHFASIGMPYAGRASVGGTRQWLQGTISTRTIVHEFGHNYGLLHASRWSTTDGSVVGAGSSVEYGDPFDIMGGGPAPAGHFHMQGKAFLNWLSSSQWTDATVAGSGVRRVHRFDSPATAPASVPRGLRILKGGTNNTNAAEYYWLGYRPGINDNSWLQRGAYLIWERPNTNQGWLLDTTPDSANDVQDSALRLGHTYSDTAAGVHLTPIAVGGSGADSWIDVNVQIGTFAGNSAPSANFSPPSSFAARTAQTFTVNASDVNGDALAYAWDFGDGNIAENAASILHSWIVGGTYHIHVTVSDMKGGTATRTASVTVTDPLDAWTTSTIAAGRTITDVAYLEGRFIAAGGGRAYFSLDGHTWSETFLSSNSQSGGLGLATDGDVFILAGHDWSGSAWVSSIHRSTDGRAWQKIPSPATEELRDVAHGGGVFVAVGDSGTIQRSTDGGLTWTQSVAPGAASLDAVAYGNGLFLAVGDTAVYTSPDGLAWTDRSAQTLLESWHNFRDVIFADGAFYAGGWDSGIHRTTDAGLTWTKATILGAGSSYDIRSLATGAGLLVASAERLGNPGVTVQIVSSDGLVWQESTGTISARTDSLAYGPGVFLSTYGSAGASARSGSLIAGNQAPSASISAPATTSARVPLELSANASDPDGDTLTLLWDFGDGSAIAEGPAPTHTYSAGGNYTVTLAAIDRRGGVTTANHPIIVTDPLDAWTTSTIGADRTITNIAYLEGRFIAAGNNRAYFSLDGQTWSESFLSANHRSGGLATDGDVFILAGHDWSGSAWVSSIHRSTDGRAWQKIPSPAAEELRDVAHGGGVFVAVGDSGTIQRSTDGGLTWTQSTAPGIAGLDSVAYGNGLFLAVGDTAVYTSPDGLAWTDRGAQTLLQSWHNFRDVIFADGAFYAGGWVSGIHRTTDAGLTWTKATILGAGSSYDIRSLATGAGLLVASAERLGNPGVTVQIVSSDGLVWQESTGTISARTDSLTYGPGVFLSTYGSAGASARSGSLIAGNQAPSASISAPATTSARVPLELSANASDPDGDTLTLLWDFGDGSPLAEGSAATHAYAAAGSYTVTLTAIDRRGGVTTANHQVIVTDIVTVASVHQPDNWIGTKRGRQIGDNRYNGNGSGQQIRVRTKAGRRVSFFVTAQNDGNGSDILSVKGTKSTRNFRIAYFQMTPAARNVTGALVGRGHSTPVLSPAQTVEFKVQIASRKRFSKNSILVTSISRSNPSKRDVVKAIVIIGR